MRDLSELEARVLARISAEDLVADEVLALTVVDARRVDGQGGDVALARARECVETAARKLEEHRAGELIAEDLRQGQKALEEITGVFTADDLLGRIFGSFCIGK